MDKLKIIKELALIFVIVSYAISLIINAIANYIVAINSKKPPKPRKLGGFRRYKK
ncbi:MAG: hypothetical protein RSG95_03565 [Bacilli bacterium]